MRNRSGSGLIEPLISLVVLVSAALPLVAGLGVAGSLTRHGRGVARASDRAECALERAAAMRFDALGKAPEGVVVERLEPGLVAVRAEASFARPGGRGEARVQITRLVADPMVALRAPALPR